MKVTCKIVGRLAPREWDKNDGTKGSSRTVLVEFDQYSGAVPVEFFGDKQAIADNLKREDIDSEKVIGINLKGREYQGKYYASISGYFIGDPGSEEAAPATESNEVPFE